MKRKVILIFLLLTTLIFAEEKQVDETRELREKVIRLEAVIERIEKEQLEKLIPINYYDNALNDAKELNDKILNQIYFIMASIVAGLGYFKFDTNKKLKEEKKEIKESNAKELQAIKDKNKELSFEVEKVKSDMEKSEEKLKIKNNELQNKFNLTIGAIEFLQAKNYIPEINSGSPFAIKYFVEGIFKSLKSYMEVEGFTNKEVGPPLSELIRIFDECASIEIQGIIVSNLVLELKKYPIIMSLFHEKENFKRLIQAGDITISYGANTPRVIDELFSMLEAKKYKG